MKKTNFGLPDHVDGWNMGLYKFFLLKERYLAFVNILNYAEKGFFVNFAPWYLGCCWPAGNKISGGMQGQPWESPGPPPSRFCHEHWCTYVPSSHETSLKTTHFRAICISCKVRIFNSTQIDALLVACTICVWHSHLINTSINNLWKPKPINIATLFGLKWL